MNNVLERLPRDARVAIIRLRSMGDCILTTPAIDILHRFRPDLRVGIAVENRFADLFEGNPEIERTLEPSISAIRSWDPALCLDFHGGNRSALLTAASRAGLRAGYAHFRYAIAYNVRIPTAQAILGVTRKVHTAEHLASAIFFLGAPQVEIPRASLFAADMPHPKRPYAVIHPFASHPDKTWPTENYANIARHIGGELEPVFIGGPSDDFTPFRGWRTLAGAPLASLKSLIRFAALFLGNDSGPAHIAAAFGVPAVVLFGNSDVEVWRPWRTPSEVIQSSLGIEGIAEDQVLHAVERLRVHV
jgi:heptosyltransferase III